MKYWSSISWKAVVSRSKGDDTTKILSQPIALIGSHPACNVRLDEIRIPSLAYIAVAFEDSVEVWPLCALAYSKWGIVSPKNSLRVGQKKINLSLSKGRENPKQNKLDSEVSGIEQPVEEIPLHIFQVDIQGEMYPFALGRRVVILGNDHPSTFRIHGAGLAPCSHAIVNFDLRCWLVNLQPKPNQSIDDLVQVLHVGAPTIEIGRLRVSYRLSTSEELSNHQSSTEAAMLVRSKKTDSMRRQRKRDARTRKLLGSASEDPNSLSVPVRRQSFAAESVTSNITNRLVTLNQSRRWWRVFKAGFFGLLFLSALGTLAWIVVEHLVPIIMEIEGR